MEVVLDYTPDALHLSVKDDGSGFARDENGKGGHYGLIGMKERASHIGADFDLASVGQVGDARLLLMAALLITDDYFDATAQLESRAKQLGDLTGARDTMSAKLGSTESKAAAALEAAAKRMGLSLSAWLRLVALKAEREQRANG